MDAHIQMKKNIIKGTLALAVVGLIGATFMSANASANKRAGLTNDKNFGQQLTEEQRTEMEAVRAEHQTEMTVQREAAQTALANSDYAAWKEAVGSNNPFADKITEENFPKFVEAHNLMQQAQDIMAELGLERPGMGQFKGEHKGFGMHFNK